MSCGVYEEWVISERSSLNFAIYNILETETHKLQKHGGRTLSKVILDFNLDAIQFYTRK